MENPYPSMIYKPSSKLKNRTWLQGDIFDETVKDGEAVTAAVELTRDLLGLDEEAQFTKHNPKLVSA